MKTTNVEALFSGYEALAKAEGHEPGEVE